MKYILAVTLLLSVLGLGSCARSSSKLPWMTQKWLHTVEGRENINHGINKRQSSEDDFEYPDAECYTEITRLACQTGLREQNVRIKLNCGNNYAAEIAAAECDRNEAGEFCGTVNSTLTDELLETAHKSCIQDPPTPSAGDSCPSPECAKSLEAIQNSPPGCCVYTPRYDYRYDNSLDTLWSQCGIEILEQCEETISRSPLPNAMQCSELDEEYITKTIMVQCSGQFNTILSQVENMDGCSQIRREYDRICQINSQDENCYFVFNETLLNEAQNECNMTQTSNSCSDSCREALESFRKEQGCCFNFFFNNTIDFEVKYAYKPFLASYTLWSECGVETPPLTCRNLLSKAHCKDLTILTLVLTLLVAMWNN